VNEIRIGKVSFVNYAAGTVRVVYPDRSDKSTAELPVFCGFGKEYQMPDVGDLVLVVHLSNDSSMGIAMGKFWNQSMAPKKSGADVYYKEFQKEGAAFLEAAAGIMRLHAASLILEDNSGSISVSELLAMKRKVDSL